MPFESRARSVRGKSSAAVPVTAAASARAHRVPPGRGTARAAGRPAAAACNSAAAGSGPTARRPRLAGAVAGDSRRLLIGLALARIDADREHRPAEPALHGRSRTWAGRGGGELAQPGAVESGIVGVEHAFGERDGLAAEAADLLQALDPAGERAHHRAAHFIRGRAGADEIGDHGVEPARDRVGVLARLHVDLDLEHG